MTRSSARAPAPAPAVPVGAERPFERSSGGGEAPPLRAVLVLMALAVAGCTRGSTSERPPIHLNPNMDDQPRYEAQAESDFFYDGKAMRTPVAGTIARGSLAEDEALITGTAGGAPVDRSPIPIDEELLTRGAERYAIYCAPCHAQDGSGQSMLRERAGVATADLNQPRLLTVSDGYLFDVITNGLGLMPAYRYPVPPRDRWAIVAWMRQLQEEAGASTVEPAEAEPAGTEAAAEDAAAAAGEEAAAETEPADSAETEPGDAP